MQVTFTWHLPARLSNHMPCPGQSLTKCDLKGEKVGGSTGLSLSCTNIGSNYPSPGLTVGVPAPEFQMITFANDKAEAKRDVATRWEYFICVRITLSLHRNPLALVLTVHLLGDLLWFLELGRVSLSAHGGPEEKWPMGLQGEAERTRLLTSASNSHCWKSPLNSY